MVLKNKIQFMKIFQIKIAENQSSLEFCLENKYRHNYKRKRKKDFGAVSKTGSNLQNKETDYLPLWNQNRLLHGHFALLHVGEGERIYIQCHYVYIYFAETPDKLLMSTSVNL